MHTACFYFPVDARLCQGDILERVPHVYLPDAHHAGTAWHCPDGPDKKAIQRLIEVTDRQMNRLVYELYRLTDDEIRIIEEESSS